MDAASRLGLASETYEGLAERFESSAYEGFDCRFLPDYRGPLERGTAVVERDGDLVGVVRGFPKVPRTLVLEEGIPRRYDGRVVVEEKLNGYNVRIARLDGRVLAFTRSGRICPFTTAKVDRWLELETFFEDHPEVMLCGEVVGPENPYTAHDYDDVESLGFRAFDVRNRRSGEPMPVEERRALCATHDVPTVPLLGTYDVGEAAAAVAGHVDDLEARGREGVVLKVPDGGTELKYTTSAANRGDLSFAFSLPFDYGQDFMFRRLVREAFRAVERGEDDDELAARAAAVGESVLRPMVETIRTVEAGDLVGERHTVRGRPGVVDSLLDHLRDQHLELVVEADGREGDERVVTFLKVTRSTTDKTRTYLDGHIVKE